MMWHPIKLNTIDKPTQQLLCLNVKTSYFLGILFQVQANTTQNRKLMRFNPKPGKLTLVLLELLRRDSLICQMLRYLVLANMYLQMVQSAIIIPLNEYVVKVWELEAQATMLCLDQLLYVLWINNWSIIKRLNHLQ